MLLAKACSASPVPPADLDILALRDLPAGAAMDAWAALRAVPGVSGEPRLAGFANFEQGSCFATVALQVLLRLPAVALWLCHHAAVCDFGVGCVACALWRSREALLASRPRVPELVLRLAEFPALSRFASGEQHDADDFMTSLLAALHMQEVDAGRFAVWSGLDGGEGRASHVDRPFGFLQEQRLACDVCAAPGTCGSVTARCAASLVWRLPNPGLEEPKRVWTTTGLYFRSAAARGVEFDCPGCASRTGHREQVCLLSAPNVLILYVDRVLGGAGGVSRHLVQPELVLTLPGSGVSYELASIVYHRGVRVDSGHYYCLVRTSGAGWHRFDDGHVRPFRGDVERSELRAVYMVVYTRPRGAASFAHMGSLQESWRPPAAAGAVAAGCGGAVAASRAAAPSVSAGGGGPAAPAPASRGAFAPWVRDEVSSWG